LCLLFKNSHYLKTALVPWDGSTRVHKTMRWTWSVFYQCHLVTGSIPALRRISKLCRSRKIVTVIWEDSGRFSYTPHIEYGLCFWHAFRITTSAAGGCHTLGLATICCRLHVRNFVSDGARRGVGQTLAGYSYSFHKPSSLCCSPRNSTCGFQHRFVPDGQLGAYLALLVYGALLFECIFAWRNLLVFVMLPRIGFDGLLLRTIFYG
jgi:hypothetical protein